MNFNFIEPVSKSTILKQALSPLKIDLLRLLQRRENNGFSNQVNIIFKKMTKKSFTIRNTFFDLQNF